MSNAVMSAFERTSTKRSDKRMNRGNGKIPGVVYGKMRTPQPIYVDEKELYAMLRSGAASGGVFRLNVPAQGEQTVMLAEVQRDKVLQRILHVDFHQIDMNATVKATVRVELTGEPEGVREGGILQAMTGTVEVRCRASEIPSAITADVSELKLGSHLFARDLQLPPGVELWSEESEMIATVLAPQKELAEASDEIRDLDVATDTAEKVEANKD